MRGSLVLFVASGLLFGGVATFAIEELISVFSTDPASVKPGNGWVLAGESAEAVQWLYEPTSTRNGVNVTAWIIGNAKSGHFLDGEPAGKKSIRALEEFDCAWMQERLLAGQVYSKANGGGRMMWASPPNYTSPGWSPIPPDTLIRHAADVACSLQTH